MRKIIKLFISLAVLVLIGMGSLLLMGYVKVINTPTTLPEKSTHTPVKKVPSKVLSKEENKFAISASTKEAAKVGEDILKKGGNAVDAAVAISYALGVSEPYGSGIGGGGGMLIYSPGKGYKALDYRDRGPSSQLEMDATMPGVPGFVAGMEIAAQKYGKLEMTDLIKPSIKLAEKGMVVSEIFARFISNYGHILRDNSDYLNNEGELYTVGETIHLPKLAKTLKGIAKEGSDYFYQGDVANKIKELTWLLPADLADVVVDEREPVVTKVFGHEVATLPAPFAGVTLLQMLKMAEATGLPNSKDDPNGYLGSYVTIKNLSYDDRKKNIADPNFYPSTAKDLVSDEYINRLLTHTDLSSEATEYDSTNTTHFTVIDNEGMIVSATNTLGYFFGSGIEVEGVYLNSAMRSFAQTGRGINKYEPGKKPRNFTTPMIINENSGRSVAIGTPGGNMIPEFMFQVLVDHYLFGETFENAAQKNRLNFLESNQLLIESNPERSVFLKPTVTGFDSKISDDYFGSIQVVSQSPDGELSGVADTRREGQVIISQ